MLGGGVVGVATWGWGATWGECDNFDYILGLWEVVWWDVVAGDMVTLWS